jgi:uncharacterized protein (TIGR03435 family)
MNLIRCAVALVAFAVLIAWAQGPAASPAFEVAAVKPDSERYAIVAKAGGPATEEQLRLMLQSLLVDRCKIALHRDTKEMTVSVLTPDKNGPKFTASAEAGNGGVHYEMNNRG